MISKQIIIIELKSKCGLEIYKQTNFVKQTSKNMCGTINEISLLESVFCDGGKDVVV